MTKENGHRYLVHSLAACLVLPSGTAAHAAGFYISEVGTPTSLGTAGAANVTNNWGPDAAWANPAGLTGMQDTVSSAGLQVIAPTMEWDTDIAEKGGKDGGNSGEAAGVPSFFFHQALTDKWHFGFGFSALQGGGADYGDDFVGRYGTIDIALTGIGATYSLGYKVNDRLSLGFGGSVVHSNYEQDIAINLGPLPDGKVKIKDADDTGVQPIAGLQYAITDDLFFGVMYRAEFDANLKGNVEFKNLPSAVPLPSQTNIKLEWKNPQTLDAGLRYKLGNSKMLFISGNWQQWSEFSENQLIIDTAAGNVPTTLDRDWDDTWSVSVGYGNIDTYRGFSMGIAYESSPADDDVRTIDFPVEENWKFSAAYGRAKESGRGWSAGATLQVFGDAKIDQTTQGVRFKGDFSDFYVLFAGVTMRN
jgi:long-chain fatty acid transport protein